MWKALPRTGMATLGTRGLTPSETAQEKPLAPRGHIHEILLKMYLKGPLKYFLRPLLGRNQFAVTQRTYVCIGPNLDKYIEGKYGSVHDVIGPRPMSRDRKQKIAF